VRARAACDPSPDLSRKIPNFHARQVSRIQGLLEFGAEQNLCFGIELVDTRLLTEPVDIDIADVTTVQDVITKVMGPAHTLSIKPHYWVIEVSSTERTNLWLANCYFAGYRACNTCYMNEGGAIDGCKFPR